MKRYNNGFIGSDKTSNNGCFHCGGCGCNICCCPQGPAGPQGPIGPEGPEGPQGPPGIFNLVDGNASGSVRGIDTATGYTMGIDAVAIGTDTTASGNASFAQGKGTTASGNYSHAEGGSAFYTPPEASGEGAHAEGTASIASGFGSHAEGTARATGTWSHAEGEGTTASGPDSHTEGQGCRASDNGAHAEGAATEASGYYSHCEGFFSIASGSIAHAAGAGTIAAGNFQTVIGRSNVSNTNDAFIIGNGSTFYPPSVRSNAFRVEFNGNVHSASGVYTTGADYAEMFEWKDGNPQKEDRIGYFVTLTGDCISKATATSSYILGIVSSAPSMIANAQSCGWQGMYLQDKWGRTQYEWVDAENQVPEIDRTTGELIERFEKVRAYQPKLNPAYNANMTYQPRAERTEWAAVGMMGQLRVHDDGTCQPNGFCHPNADGAATAATDGYYVMKRLDRDIVLVLFDGPRMMRR